MEALLLRSVNYKDADRILTLLVRGVGTVDALARGARSSRKRHTGLEPFCLLDVQLEAKRSLWNLKSCSIARPFPGLLRNYRVMMELGKTLELLKRAMEPEDPHDDLLEEILHLFASLSDLAPSQNSQRAVTALISTFLLICAYHLGLQPQLHSCSGCDRVPLPTQPSFFDPERGSLRCRACGGCGLLLHGESRQLASSLFDDALLHGGWTDLALSLAEPSQEAVLSELQQLATLHLETQVRR